MDKLTDEQKEVINKIILDEIIENGILHIYEVLPEHKILDDLELDFTLLTCVIIQIESELGIVLNDYDVEICETVNDLHQLIYKTIETKNC